ncbi:MAG: hypothetical protein GF347_00695 [Candidatus Moranbacteria bacterium]|nr:hypothetical protein [Candidatus Moranbacteria bacterium]
MGKFCPPVKKDNLDITQKEIFVIKPYDKEYRSDRIATLLVNKELKKKFDEEYNEIKENKESFLSVLREFCGIKKIEEIEKEISKVFYQGEENKFWESLERIEKEVLSEDNPYKSIKYSEIFNDKTTKILLDKNFSQNIEEYVTKYNQLLDQSIFFKKGVFDWSLI